MKASTGEKLGMNINPPSLNILNTTEDPNFSSAGNFIDEKLAHKWAIT